jgi:hypothetical protein
MKKIYLYTDIDYVLSLASERTKKQSKWGYIHKFNNTAVKVLNSILEQTMADIIITSHWKNDFTLQQLQEIFVEWAGVCRPPIDVTPYVKGATTQKLQEYRAKEILEHVLINKPDSWVAIDDLDLRPWIPNNYFVHLSRSREGIKQSGKKEQIIKKLQI